MSSSLSLSSYSSLFGYDTLNPSVSNYSRKDKSLALLCSNFLKLYNRDDVECVGVDAAAAQLGVERRRIYDIVNIMESIGVLVRKAKNQYCWKGFDAIPQALHDLQISNEKETERSPSDSNKEEKSVSCPKTESRKEKSLALLAKNFVKLFLRSGADIISLDSAATALPAKARRLYDIANVFASMNLIEKVRHPESGKPAFRWLGMKQKSSNALEAGSGLNDTRMRVFGTEITNTASKRFAESISNCQSSGKQINVEMGNDENLLKQHQLHQSKDPESGEPAFRQLVQNSRSALETGFGSNDNKRRTFGTEITNTASKRFKDNSLSNCRSSEKVSVPTYAKQHNVKTENDENSMKQHQRHQSKGFVFGPFSPASIRDLDALENNKVGRIQDWEQLASTYFPRYQNQAVSDLITHYADAWKSWLVEVDEKKPTQTAS
ncbi:E2F transcription factor-like E2FF isoform X2 [Daucus carota subsp. sativus]|uniref:E2F transcription factor-like E2FF isoform X2 n=1 Tax=Daucus carota subsp. sativus TaxID=79200 RepID=UPI003083C458